VRENFQLTPKGIIESLKLRVLSIRDRIVRAFGRKDPDFTWEATDKAAKLREQGLGAGSKTNVGGCEVDSRWKARPF